MNYRVFFERVHTVKSLEYFMKYAHHEDVVAVHWNGHGYAWESEATANRITELILSADRLYLPQDDEVYLRACLDKGTWRKQRLTPGDRRIIEDNLLQYELIRSVFSQLDGKLLIFSACDIGKPRGLAEYVSRVSGAKAVITYDGFVTDEEANVVEVLLYYRLLSFETKKRTSGRIVAEVRDVMTTMLGHSVPIVCYENGLRTAGVQMGN